MEEAPGAGIITLITDFGWRDQYVGAVKGIIHGINPSARIEDIAHDVTSHDIRQAAFTLYGCYRFWPRGSVHLVVVDPGVGSDRRRILVETDSYLLTGPDNGIFSMIYDYEDYRVIELTEKKFFLKHISGTFHARDVFAPVAAYLSVGVAPDEFGQVVTDPVKFDFPAVEQNDEGIQGEVVYSDRFGNLVTNIPSDYAEASGTGEICNTRVRIADNYEQGKNGEPFLIRGSTGFIEVSVNKGAAADLLDANVGEKVFIRLKNLHS